MLIYGEGKAGVLALHEIQGNPALDMKAVGFLDDDAGQRKLMVQGFPVHSPGELGDLIAKRGFDGLVLASGKIRAERAREVAERCAGAGIGVRRFRIAWDEVPPTAVTTAAMAATAPAQAGRAVLRTSDILGATTPPARSRGAQGATGG